MDRVMLQGYQRLAVVPLRVDRTVNFHLVAAMFLSRISCQPCTLLSRCHPWGYIMYLRSWVIINLGISMEKLFFSH